MKKKVLIITLIFLIVVAFLVFFLLFNEKKEENFIVPKEDISYFKSDIEVYSSVKLSDIIELNGYSIVNDYEIDTSETGAKELSFEYVNFDETKKGKITINVVDTTGPYIGIGDHYSHIINTNFTFYDDVLCADNYDRNISCEIIGEYDINTLGETELKISAEDKSGNKTIKEFELRVIEKPKDEKAKEVITIEEALKRKDDNAKLMIDVSKWQKDIDWKKVKEAGIDYVMLRLGTQKALDKESVIDEYFEKNIREARENDIKVGVYYFSYANDVDDAKEQAEWVIEQLKSYKLDLPVSFDWESWKYFKDFNMNLHDLNELSRVFLDTIAKSGYDTINYGSKNYLENIWEKNDYPIWLAHYTDKTNYKGDYIMWQFTDRGIVPGIVGYVDLDYYYE